MTSIPTLATSELPVHRYSADHYTGLREEWRDIVQHGHLLYNLVYRDLTVRYKRSVIGFFWTMLNPLLLMTIFVVIFSTLFRFALPHYETYFLSEYLPWTFFSQTTVTAMQSMSWNGALMKRVRVPKSIFALASTISGLVNLLLSYIPLLLIMAIRGVPIRTAILFLPVSFAILAIFTFGVSLALSAISVYFVDVREMYAVLLTGVMYMCPIIYPISIVPARFRQIIVMNPLMYVLQIVRDPIYNGRLPEARDLNVALFAAVLAFLIGWAVFRRLARGFYPHL
ncbi:MAG: ABC transporter permease [Thermoanaerobaculia bacterium]